MTMMRKKKRTKSLKTHAHSTDEKSMPCWRTMMMTRTKRRKEIWMVRTKVRRRDVDARKDSHEMKQTRA
jgi:hypothetical protein